MRELPACPKHYFFAPNTCIVPGLCRYIGALSISKAPPYNPYTLLLRSPIVRFSWSSVSVFAKARMGFIDACSGRHPYRHPELARCRRSWSLVPYTLTFTLNP